MAASLVQAMTPMKHWRQGTAPAWEAVALALEQRAFELVVPVVAEMTVAEMVVGAAVAGVVE